MKNDSILKFSELLSSVLEEKAKGQSTKSIDKNAYAKFEDVVGLTTPNKDENGVLQTKFTAPPLWTKIMNQYDPSITIPGSSYTHILFLDEITRASKRVMNSIRSLMLEKKVNANYAIPDDMMIVTALNPTDTGTEELSDHLADVNGSLNIYRKFLKTIEKNVSNDVYLRLNKPVSMGLVMNPIKINLRTAMSKIHVQSLVHEVVSL